MSTNKHRKETFRKNACAFFVFLAGTAVRDSLKSQVPRHQIFVMMHCSKFHSTDFEMGLRSDSRKPSSVLKEAWPPLVNLRENGLQSARLGTQSLLSPWKPDTPSKHRRDRHSVDNLRRFSSGDISVRAVKEKAEDTPST